ncbi:unnamed protein product [Symbiodinium sp. CCMP2592]|nr:unnamed protein product [Symbiodinium sp. CCMP2592]
MMGTVTWAARRMMEVVQTAPDLRQTKDIVLCHVPASSGAKACPKLSKDMIRRASHTAQEQIPPVPVPGDCLSMDPEATPVSPGKLSDCSACNIPTHRFVRGSSVDSLESLLSTTSSMDCVADRCSFPE